MGNGMDLRREVRTPMLFPPLLLNKDGRGLARVADLSPHGALLYARSGVFSHGETVSGWLHSPPIDDDEIVLAVGVNVRWVSVDRERGWTRVGCELHRLDQRSLTGLWRLIEKASP
ncbi:PilZ domain-containing protein [Paraburkholderia fungorum]|jgi:hypothetical protein|uniref:PilZ domain-containing protein n=2 Tax=Paraburkholderia TaxID=1822464 RepID=A0A1H1JR75_9BURK|nr:PilZ domain-containing protein [Paraburkholderia fungorum]